MMGQLIEIVELLALFAIAILPPVLLGSKSAFILVGVIGMIVMMGRIVFVRYDITEDDGSTDAKERILAETASVLFFAFQLPIFYTVFAGMIGWSIVLWGVYN